MEGRTDMQYPPPQIAAERNPESTYERGGLSFFLFCVWTFILIGRPQDYFSFMAAFRPVLLITALTAAFTFLEGKRFPPGFFQIREIKLLFIFYIILVVGIPFAVHRRVAFDFAFITYVSTLAYFALFLIHVRSLWRLKKVLWVSVLGGAFLSILYLKETIVERIAGVGRISASQMYDPNDIAMVFVSLFPLAIFYGFGRARPVRRLVGFLTALLIVLGTMVTQSRGGVIGLALVIGFLFLSSYGTWKGGKKIVALVVLGGIFLLNFGMVERRFERMETDYNIEGEGGRLHIWRQSLDVFLKYPVLGVGGGCSPIAIGFYRQEMGGIQAWQVTHSSIIQIALETGVPGFIVMALLNIGAIQTLRRIQRRKEKEELATLALFAKLGLYGFWSTAFFLSHGYSIMLYFLLAIAIVLKGIEAQMAGEENAGKVRT
jgi:O-antigen ligase